MLLEDLHAEKGTAPDREELLLTTVIILSRYVLLHLPCILMNAP